MYLDVSLILSLIVLVQTDKTKEVLSSQDFRLDPSELESKFSSKTKAIIFNNPNNPLGKVRNKHTSSTCVTILEYFHCLQVFELDEMTLIADLCKKHDVMVISDDVYEWLIYPDSKMIKIGM